MSQVGSIVLCGGLSRRMGRSKAWLPFGPESLLQRVVRQLGKSTDPIVVVAAPEQELPALPEEVIVVRDPVEGQGPLQALEIGLGALPVQAELAYVSATDAPFLRDGWIDRLAGLIDDNDLVIPEAGGHCHPLAALYRVETTRRAAKSLVLDGHSRLLELLDRLRTVHVFPPALAVVDPNLDSLRNLNTLDDYHQALVEAGFATVSGRASLDARGSDA